MKDEALRLALEFFETMQRYKGVRSKIFIRFEPTATGDYLNLQEFDERAKPVITAIKAALEAKDGCQCPACKVAPHASDCAVHNEPAYPTGECNCGASVESLRKPFEKWQTENFSQKPIRYAHTYKNTHVRCRWQGWLAAHGIKGEV
jgi:hypothetical protein